MLIELQDYQNHPDSKSKFPSPVVGLHRDDMLPTSVDVHLYPDPDSFNKSTPLLYADCEGLAAGEIAPLASRHQKRHKSDIRRNVISGGNKRELLWANTREKQSRKFIVSELYPRLLYTFSDTVVFVLKNVK